MANKEEAATKITRIRASDGKPGKVAAKKDASKQRLRLLRRKSDRPRKVRRWTKPFRAVGGYFRGAWVELTQVHWPTRHTTWGMTGALIGFTIFFVVIIQLLDAAFGYLFKLIIGQ